MDTYNDAYERHKGETCFVVAPGPSLSRVAKDTLARLVRQTTVGVGSLCRCPWWPASPTYYVATESRMIAETDKWLSTRDSEPCERWIVDIDAPVSEEWRYVPMAKHSNHWPVAPNLAPMPDAPCATLKVLPLLCWLGFSRIYLVGCDTSTLGYAYDNSVLRDEKPDLIDMAAHKITGYMAQQGVELLDCTEGGNLTVPRQRLEVALGIESPNQ